jgi:hypothetical protein
LWIEKQWSIIPFSFCSHITISNLSEDIKIIFTVIFASVNRKTNEERERERERRKLKKKQETIMYTDDELL